MEEGFPLAGERMLSALFSGQSTPRLQPETGIPEKKRFLQKSLTPSFLWRKPESRIALKSWIPGRASLARNDDFPMLSKVLQEPQKKIILTIQFS
jgi:hypothetical protein